MVGIVLMDKLHLLLVMSLILKGLTLQFGLEVVIVFEMRVK